jgi:hypothetical protein
MPMVATDRVNSTFDVNPSLNLLHRLAHPGHPCIPTTTHQARGPCLLQDLSDGDRDLYGKLVSRVREREVWGNVRY